MASHILVTKQKLHTIHVSDIIEYEVHARNINICWCFNHNLLEAKKKASSKTAPHTIHVALHPTYPSIYGSPLNHSRHLTAGC